MEDVITPHFDLPFRFGLGGSAVVIEQDSPEDVINCVNAVVRTPIGFRLELPDFGIPDPVFAENGPNENELREYINRWEPRAESIVNSNLSGTNQYKVDVLVPVRTEDSL